jgi:tripartite motif-containing protein 71
VTDDQSTQLPEIVEGHDLDEPIDPETGLPIEDPPDAAAAPRRGLYLTPRQAFAGIAIVLGVLLVALLVYALFFMGKGGGLLTRGGDEQAGIRPLFVIDGPGKGVYPRFDRPMGAAFGLDGRIYVTDTGHNRVCVFDSSGAFLFEFGTFGVAKPLPGAKNTWAPGRINYPVGIDVDQDGSVYVADFRNDQIQVFDPEGKPLRSFPDPQKSVGKGSSGQDGTGIAVTDVAVRGGKVYATDTFQVFVFNADGSLARQFGKPGLAPGDLDHPNGVAVGEDGTVYVSDSNHARVTAFTSEGKLKWNLGRPPSTSADATSSVFSLPRGITALDSGDLVVVDAFNFDLARVSAAGKLVGRYGERGVEPGQFNFPNDVDALGNRLVVADKENNRVQVVEIVTE